MPQKEQNLLWPNKNQKVSVPKDGGFKDRHRVLAEARTLDPVRMIRLVDLIVVYFCFGSVVEPAKFSNPRADQPALGRHNHSTMLSTWKLGLKSNIYLK